MMAVSSHPALNVFNFEGHEVRTTYVDEEPWFVANDVSSVLLYGEASAMTRHLDDDEKGLSTRQTPGGIQELLVISESGLYSAILRSRKPEAKRFKKWVTSVLLPGLRKKEFVHVSEAPISNQALTKMVTDSLRELHQDMRAEMKEIRSMVTAQASKAPVAKKALPAPAKPGDMTKDEIKRRGLITAAMAGVRLGMTTSRFNTILEVLGYHTRVVDKYTLTSKARNHAEVVGHTTDRKGEIRAKHLWKESILAQIPSSMIRKPRMD
jgi:prophage antirepressor-like protein